MCDDLSNNQITFIRGKLVAKAFACGWQRQREKQSTESDCVISIMNSTLATEQSSAKCVSEGESKMLFVKH